MMGGGWMSGRNGCAKGEQGLFKGNSRKGRGATVTKGC